MKSAITLTSRDGTAVTIAPDHVSAVIESKDGGCVVHCPGCSHAVTQDHDTVVSAMTEGAGSSAIEAPAPVDDTPPKAAAPAPVRRGGNAKG